MRGGIADGRSANAVQLFQSVQKRGDVSGFELSAQLEAGDAGIGDSQLAPVVTVELVDRVPECLALEEEVAVDPGETALELLERNPTGLHFEVGEAVLMRDPRFLSSAHDESLGRL